MLTCQKDKFGLPYNVSYLNCAYFSPLLKAVEKVGHEAVSMKSLPFSITVDDFFEPVQTLKSNFARLIDAESPERIALVPGVSYGITNAAKNIPLEANDEIIVLSEQFPSNVYPWQQRAVDTGAKIVTIAPEVENRGKSWNEKILESINEKTKVVALAHAHWTDGTLFQLKSIRERCNEFKAYLVIDGSQSVGALPFSVKEINPDVLVCAGYKWLLGPYSLSLAYYNDRFDHGEPIEACWINKDESEDFQNLANYRDGYKPMANRYNVSESSNFILVPMLSAAIEQLVEWNPKNIQEYCKSISENTLRGLSETGCTIEQDSFRTNHLFGIRLSDKFNLEKIKSSMKENNVFVSFRGSAIRVAPHLYNTQEDLHKLKECILEGLKN